jgi:hypothetical protein
MQQIQVLSEGPPRVRKKRKGRLGRRDAGSK